ncbi:glutaminyl-peptide cyclotransferase [Chryseobacterium profundimaris]|uniref:Glutamine cyclotransferase n=1 Tax=Chryseobacterium profundimaris TaxID=1387275 RepID=A0ABY1NK83_9FLAO|nr:glutaminyl-peptide cyclotransferase [Chryseobacterium profundimaris]SMP11592.1 Glutamine cyclotransferase [Chryseobacterium profundimaris]
MNKSLFSILSVLFLLISCRDDQKVLDILADYNRSMEQKGYRFGDRINLPEEITDNADKVTIGFGDKETSEMNIDPKFFEYGENKVTFSIKTKNGETLSQDATINVFSKNKEQDISYKIVAEYPHDPNNFLEGFLLEGNMVYESDGLKNSSQLIKYTLGSTTPIITEKQPDPIFSEGCAIAGDKIFQLTYQNKQGFIYDKTTLKKLSEFPLPNEIGEGWGLTFDGKNLVATDGSNKLYFLDVDNPSRVVHKVAVGGYNDIYTQLNELEYHDGFIYSNVWHQPYILKINPKTGEAVGKFDFKKITEENTKDDKEHVLNGIAFKGDNMLVTGKNWPKIYEVAIK